jgi:hypothetical protein
MAPFESYMNGYENYETSARLWEWQLKRAVPGLSPRVVGHELRTPYSTFRECECTVSSLS